MPLGLGGPDGRLGLPEAVWAQEGVEQAGEPAHDGDDDHFVGLALGGEALVAGSGGWLAANRGLGGHAGEMAGLGPSAADGAADGLLAGVAVEGGEAEQGGDLAAAEGAELGHGGAEAGSVDGPEAGDRMDDGVAAGERGVGGDAVAHAAVAVGDSGLRGVEHGRGAGSVLEGELRTVLLIGELGEAANDPPVKVLVVDDLLSDRMTGRSVNFRGAETHVIPLDAGPTLVLAEVVPEDGWSMSGRGPTCPAGTRQMVRATWAGGVRLPNGDDPGDAERALYRVTVERPDGSRDEIAPADLAELGDSDNNHLLCLGTADTAVSVAFPAGHLVDPNRDLNPDTAVAVATPSPPEPHEVPAVTQDRRGR